MLGVGDVSKFLLASKGYLGTQHFLKDEEKKCKDTEVKPHDDKLSPHSWVTRALNRYEFKL